MSLNRTEDLWTRFLADGQLSPAEEQELLGALEADPTLRHRLLADKEFDGLLDAVCTTDHDAAAFARSFQDRLAVEGDSKFIAKVEERIRRTPARKPRRFTGGQNSNGLIYGMIAASIFAVIVLIALLSGNETPAPIVKTPVREVVPLPPPPPKIEPVIEVRPEPEKPKLPDPVKPAPIEINPLPPPPPEPEKKPEPVVPKPEPAPEPKPVPKVTQVVVARNVTAGADLVAGAGVEGAATVVYPDKTRLDLGAETEIQDLQDAKGKTFIMVKGVLTAEVPKQQQPMVLKTPHAEIRVLGTTLKVRIDQETTRLDVISGKVRMTRLLDNKSVDVVTGHYAVTGAGVELISKSSAPPKPKPSPILFQETFQDAAGVNARWKVIGAATMPKAGVFDIDLSAKPADGWGGGGLVTRQTFAAPMALSVDVDLPVLHPSVVAAVVFIPQGGKRGDPGVFRVQIRGSRYSLTVETGEAKELTGVDRGSNAALRERWRIETDGATVRFLAGDREIFRQKTDAAAPAGYSLEIDGSGRADAPSGAKVTFDNVVVEALK